MNKVENKLIMMTKRDALVMLSFDFYENITYLHNDDIVA